MTSAEASDAAGTRPSLSWRLAAAGAAHGGLGALAAALVRLGFRGLEWVLTGSTADPPLAAAHLHPLRRVLTPVLGVALAAAVLLVQQRVTGRRKPEPYVEYVEAVQQRGGFVPLRANAWRTLSAAFSVASGAAVGREGSMIQFAAAVASLCSRWRGWFSANVAPPPAFLVACGVVGGVTAAYNAPLAAIFFAGEIVLGEVSLWQVVPLGAAAGSAWLVAGTLLGRERLYPAPAALPLDAHLWLLLGIAGAAGVAGPGYQWLLGSLRWARRLPWPLVWSGLLVGCLSLKDVRVWGNGDVGLRAALGGAASVGSASPHSLAGLLAVRVLATLACVGTGTVGGVFTPTLFAGGTAGALLGWGPLHSSATLYAIAGMACLMASVTHAPWMAALMAAELTGNWRLVPVLLILTLLSRWIAGSLSPRTMYGIASQSPEPRGGMSSSLRKKVE